MKILNEFAKLRINWSLHEQTRGTNPLARMPWSLRRKIEENPDLYHHWKDEQELTRALRQPSAEEIPVPQDLRARILARVESEKPPKRVFFLRTGGQMAALVALFSFGLVFLLQHRPAGPVENVSTAPVHEQMAEQPDAPITLQTPLENHPLVQLSSIIELPLLEEPERLLNDAGNALRFLGKNFLPNKQWRDGVSRQLFGKKSADSSRGDV